MEIKLYITRVFEWSKRFREGKKDLEDDPTCGQQSPVQILETVATVHELVATDCQITLKLTDDESHINWETIHHVWEKQRAA
jgi:hypothetical protein